MGINSRGNRGRKALQKGISEPLFCEACEQHFNEYFEKPFGAQWVVTPQLPNPWNAIDVHWVNVCVSSHRNIEFERVALQADGRMPICAVPWNEVSVIQSASEALRHARF